MKERWWERLGVAAGVGLFGAAGLGYVNRAAHEVQWGPRAMYAAFGLYAAFGALRLAGRRRAPAGGVAGLLPSAIVVAGVLCPLAARPEGRMLWNGGLWLAAAGALLGVAATVALGESFGIVPARRGVVCRGPYAVIRHPMVVSFLAIAAGFLVSHYSLRNAAVLGVAVVLAVASAFLEERHLRKDEEYVGYAARVRWRFIPGLV